MTIRLLWYSFYSKEEYVMNILPYQIHNILKIYRDTDSAYGSGENGEPARGPASVESSIDAADRVAETDRVEISEQGRKEQIKKEILSDVIRKIR